MKRDSISVELVASGLEVTWENFAVSPERFCLTACILTLLEMMEQAATNQSRFRRGRSAGRRSYRRGRTVGRTEPR